MLRSAYLRSFGRISAAAQPSRNDRSSTAEGATPLELDGSLD
jgi:hypothetical protein